jgi:putative transposase
MRTPRTALLGSAGAAPSVSTLLRWVMVLKAEGEAGLAGRYGNRRGSGKIDRDAAIHAWLSAHAIKYQGRVSAHDLTMGLCAEFGVDAASYDQVKRWLRDFYASHRVELAWINSPDRARGQFGVAFGDMSQGVEDYLQIVELDGSPADVMTLSGSRRQLIVVKDVFSRMMWAIVAPSESAEHTARLFCRLFTHERGGLPALVRTDNGSGFVSARLRGFLGAVGVEIKPVARYRGDLKPFVESGVRYIQRIFGLMPGFLGHNLEDRARMRGRVAMKDRRGRGEAELLEVSMTDAELEHALSEWLMRVYANRPHGGLRGKTPNQMLEARPRRRDAADRR